MTKKEKNQIRMIPCPCGGGIDNAGKDEEWHEVMLAKIEVDGTITCLECGAYIEIAPNSNEEEK